MSFIMSFYIFCNFVTECYSTTGRIGFYYLKDINYYSPLYYTTLRILV